MKLSSDASVYRLTHEGIADFSSMCDFDKKSIDNLPSIYKKTVPTIEPHVTNSISSKAYVDLGKCHHCTCQLF